MPTEDFTYDGYSVNLGAVYKSNKLFIGMNVNTGKNPYWNWEDSFSYLLNASYDFSIGNNFKLTPGVYTYISFERLQYLELNFKATFMDRYWIGTAFSFDEYLSMGLFAGKSIGGFAGIDIQKKYRIAYSFRHISLFEEYNVNELVFSLMIK